MPPAWPSHSALHCRRHPSGTNCCFLVNLHHVSTNVILPRGGLKSKSWYVLYRTTHLSKHLRWGSCLEHQFYLSFMAFLSLYQNAKWDCGRTQWKIILQKNFSVKRLLHVSGTRIWIRKLQICKQPQNATKDQPNQICHMTDFIITGSHTGTELGFF